MRKRFVLMTIISIVGLIFTSQNAHAAAPMQLINVSPSSTQIKVDPGGSAKDSVMVVNLGTSSLKITFQSSPYYVEGVNYIPQFTQLPGSVAPSDWIHFTSPTTTILAGQKLTSADYTVDVPVGTAPGGYYAVIFAQMDPVDAVTSGVATHSRVGDILYITVNGKVKTGGTATAITLPKVLVDTPIPLDVLVANQGGLHFQTTIDTVVKDIFGTTTFSDSAHAYVLPQTKRQLQTQWSPQAAVGIYSINQSVSLPSGPTQLATQWVLVMKPWVIIILIAIIVVLVTTTILGIRRAKRKRTA